MKPWEDLSTNEEQFRQAVQLSTPYQPLYVKIKLTWRCNLRCIFCTVWREGVKDPLTLPLVQSLAEELASLGTRKVHLSGGEVFLRRDIFEVVASFAKRKIQVNMTTNGTLLTPAAATRLVESGIHNVSISLDGATPATHDTIRGKRNWKRTIRGIHNLRRAAKHAHRKIHIRINTVITRHNYKDIAGLPEIAHQAGADRLTLIPVDDNIGRQRLNKRRIREYNEDVAPRLAEKALAYGMIERVNEAYPFGQEKAHLELSKMGLYAQGLYKAQPCYMPWLHAMISPAGYVYPCCMMRSRPPLGNLIATGSFRAVWAGATFDNFRRQMLDPGQRPALCHACDDFSQENRFVHKVATLF